MGLKMLISQVNPENAIMESVDGGQAIELAKTSMPDLIVMNTRLPKVDGISAARAIKTSSRATCILMLSPRINRAEVLEVFDSGAEGYCSKECGADLMSSAIKSVMQGALWISPDLAEDIRQFFAEGYEREKQDELSRTATLLSFLSERELEVLTLLIDGLSNREMADKLGVSVETIKTHMRHVMEKLAVSDRTQAAIKALRFGLIRKR
jgi:DNA-binding NarL/FixJ family response regulator